jgi:hypothetical protein
LPHRGYHAGVRRLLPFLLLLAACDDDESPPVTPPVDDCPGEAPAAGDGPRFDPGPELGGTSSLHVTTRHQRSDDPGQQVFTANLRQEPLPVGYVVATTDGRCRQWIEPGFNCGLGQCGENQLCVAEDSCADAPAGAASGTLGLQLGDTPVDVPAGEVPGLYSAELPAGQACEVVRVSGEGELGSFALETRRPPRLELLGEIALVEEEPLTIRWQPAEPSSRIRVQLRADRGAHGFLFTSIIECDVPDAVGELTIPANLIDAHLDQFSCGECPFSSITRYQMVGDDELGFFVEDEVLIFLTPFSPSSEPPVTP